MEVSGLATVLVRAADCGESTYLYWMWLDEPDRPQYAVITGRRAVAALQQLTSALINPDVGPDRAVARALGGVFAYPEQERRLMTNVAEVVLPPDLAAQLDARERSTDRIVIRVTPSPRIAQVPWELLVVAGSGRRVLEIAEVRYDPPTTVHARRAARTGAQQVLVDRAVRVVDPVAINGEHRLGRVLSTADEGQFVGAALPGAKVGESVNRVWLGDRLRERPARFLYFGHVSSTPGDPASAAVHLDDDDTVYGLAAPPAGSRHRPFAALDLLLGTSEVTSRRDDVVYPHPDNIAGHEIWPMPPRVALIACESGGDARSIETFGLVMAIINAGAELVTATRWKLPTNAAFRVLVDDEGTVQPTSELLVAVDRAHASADPYDHIRSWQRERLRDWESCSPARLVDTPLVWAALATYAAPSRDTVST